jgi:hypothetical protein
VGEPVRHRMNPTQGRFTNLWHDAALRYFPR